MYKALKKRVQHKIAVLELSQERGCSGNERGEVTSAGPRRGSDGLAMVHVLVWVVATQISFGDNSLSYTFIFCTFFLLSVLYFN